MEREKFMQEARLTVHRILDGKENAIMNVVQQAWAEGKRNAEVETLRAAIDEALDKREPKEPPVDAVYPTWGEWFVEHGDLVDGWQNATNAAWMANTALGVFMKPIPADIAHKLGLEPKNNS